MAIRLLFETARQRAIRGTLWRVSGDGRAEGSPAGSARPCAPGSELK